MRRTTSEMHSLLFDARAIDRPRVPAKWVLLGLALLAASWPTVGAAQDRVVLDWVAPPECPTESDVIDALRTRLIGKAIPPSEPIDATARIEPAETGYALTLRVRAGASSGTRSLSASDCGELGAATAIILALMVEGAEPLSEPEPVPEPEPAEPDATETSSEPPEAETDEPFAPRARLRALLLGDLGALPDATLGASLEIGLPLEPSLDLWVGALYVPPVDVELEGRAEAVAELSVLAGRAAVAWLPLSESAFRSGPTLALEIGRVGGTGQNLSDDGAGHGLWLVGLLGLEARLWATRWLAFCAEIAVGLPVRHVAFTVESLGTVHELSSPFGRARLGLLLGL